MAKNVFMISGQSNARGNAAAVSVDTTLFDSYAACQFWHHVDVITPSVANEDLDNLGTTSDWGVELSLGRDLVAHGIADPLILKVCKGGISLGNLGGYLPTSEGGPGAWLAHLKTEWTAMLAANADASPDCLVWMQGEGDTQTEALADAYETNLIALLAELRAHFGSATMPVILTTMVPSYTGTYKATVEAAQDAVVASDANVYKYDCGHQVHRGDNTHWDAASLDRIGDGIANLYITDVLGAIPGGV